MHSRSTTTSFPAAVNCRPALLECVSWDTLGPSPDISWHVAPVAPKPASVSREWKAFQKLSEIQPRNPSFLLRREEREAVSWQGRNDPGKYNPTPSPRVKGREKMKKETASNLCSFIFSQRRSPGWPFRPAGKLSPTLSMQKGPTLYLSANSLCGCSTTLHSPPGTASVTAENPKQIQPGWGEGRSKDGAKNKDSTWLTTLSSAGQQVLPWRAIWVVQHCLPSAITYLMHKNPFCYKDLASNCFILWACKELIKSL